MPTTKTKNLIYRLSLPFLAPRLPRRPELTAGGRMLADEKGYIRFLRRHHVMGSSALLASDGQEAVILSSSPYPRHIPADNTLYRVASITKMATALATLVLCEEGLLSLDSPVAGYMPDGKDLPELQGVTLRHLLSHTSGLSDPVDLEKLLNQKTPWTEAVRGRRFAAPGTAFRYSNLGFGLIGCVWEYVTGLSLRDVLRRTVFTPLGIDAFIDATEADVSRIMPVSRILPYHPENDLTVTELGRQTIDAPAPLFHYGHTAGSLYITVSSLKLLLDCVRGNGEPLLHTLGAVMIKQQAAYGEISPTLSYGLGTLIISDPALSDSRILGHQGFAYGCADGAFYEESTGRTVIFLNGGCSEARTGRLGLANHDLLKWAFRKELPLWN